MRLLVNIRGCNGAGKSTIPLLMGKDPNTVSTRTDPHGTKYTVFQDTGWVALGTYFDKHGQPKKTGGMDTISTKAEKQALLAYVWSKHPEYDILMEGVIDSTILSTYVDLFKSYQRLVDAEEITPRKIVVLNLLPPVDVCLERVYKRNGGKPINEDAVRSKWKTVRKNWKAFREAGMTSIRWDNSSLDKRRVLETFLEIMDDVRER